MAQRVLEEREALPVEPSNELSLMKWQASIERRMDGFEMQLAKLLLGMNEQKVVVNDLSFLQVSSEANIKKQMGLELRLQVALAAAETETNPEHPTCWSELEDAIKDAKVADVDSQQVQMAEQACMRRRELRLQIALAAAETNPEHLTCWSELEDVIQDAKAADVDSQQLQMAEQACLRRGVEAALENSSSFEELYRAMPAAREAGIPEAKLQSIEACLRSHIDQKEKISQAQRKLRIAVSWASPQNLAKLRNAISEAEEAGVDGDEIAKAVQQLSVFSKQLEIHGSDVVRELLREAKPTWSENALDAAVDKLNDVGINSIQRLAAALSVDAPFESSLNWLLKNGGQKTFTEETVMSVRNVLNSKHYLAVDLPAATS